MTKAVPIFFGAAVFCLLGMVQSASGTDSSNSRKPSFGFSLAWNGWPPKLSGGKNFDRFQREFRKASIGGKNLAPTILSERSDTKVYRYNHNATIFHEFDSGVIAALKKDCLGPFFFDEADEWLQLSWVCDTRRPNAVSKYVFFGSSSELSVTIFFRDGLISHLVAVEPVEIPGRNRLSFDAYVKMKGGKQ